MSPRMSRRTRRRLVAVVLLLCAAALGLTWAQSPRSLGAPARVSAAGRLVFGAAPVGVASSGAARVALPWSFRGGASRRVIAVTSGCGCATVGALPPRLHPGDQGTLVITLRPRTKPGAARIRITVHMDGPAPGDSASTWLRHAGPPGLAAQPPRLEFGVLPQGLRPLRRIDVWGIPPGVALRARIRGVSGRVTVDQGIRPQHPDHALVTVSLRPQSAFPEGRLLLAAGDQTLVVAITGSVQGTATLPFMR